MILSLIVSIFVVFSNDYFHQAEKTRSCFFAINTTKHNFQEAARNFHGSIDTPVSVNDIWRSSSLQKKKKSHLSLSSHPGEPFLTHLDQMIFI